MGWSRSSHDQYHNLHVKFGRLVDAVAHCENMGFGYDISYPNKRWHVKKNYADNFKWKGEPKMEEQYD